ncbi:MAG: protein phosphatase 2C domain-containing protein [Roseburia sp.]|nr:protein phosphatase 2C domain-containing protein [Roseburia sp.]MCM1278654.1 protein phosphatase 2C domain-containing protein [Robinsoniella sp.]
MAVIFTDIRIIVTVVVCLAAIIIFAAIGMYIRIRNQNRGYRLAEGLYVDIGNAQIIGTREKQDDSFATSIQDYGVMGIVADGIGGYINGNLASQIAVETYLDEFEKRDVTSNLNYFFQKTAVLANERIRDEFGEAKGGTTVVAVVLIEDKMYWTSVGDSNIAVFRNGRLIEVNRKENVKNWLEDQYRAGAIGKEEALGSPMDKRLVNYVGYDGFKKADESDRPIFLKKKDKVLIYSDGVEALSQIELESILGKKKNAQDLADEIMQAIEEKKVRSKDNSTIIILSLK